MYIYLLPIYKIKKRKKEKSIERKWNCTASLSATQGSISTGADAERAELLCLRGSASLQIKM